MTAEPKSCPFCSWAMRVQTIGMGHQLVAKSSHEPYCILFHKELFSQKPWVMMTRRMQWSMHGTFVSTT